jgi:hypothetical protein
VLSLKPSLRPTPATLSIEYIDWTSDIDESSPATYRSSFEPIEEAIEMDSFVTNDRSAGQGKNKEHPAFPTSPEPNDSQNIGYPIETTDMHMDLEKYPSRLPT